MNFYFKDHNQDQIFLEVINNYNLAYWIAADIDLYLDSTNDISAYDYNRLIQQFNYATELFNNTDITLTNLKKDHKKSAEALRDFVDGCIQGFHFFKSSKKIDSESKEIELIGLLERENKFHIDYLRNMNPSHAEYLTIKSFSYINEIAADLLLVDPSLGTNTNKDRSTKIVAAFSKAKNIINYALKNVNCFDGIIDEFEIINKMRPDSLNHDNFLDLCDKNIEYMKLWREFYAVYEQFYQDTLIENTNIEYSDFELVEYETQNYQAQINIFAIDIIQSTLRFMGIDTPTFEIYSKRLLKNPLNFIKTA